MDCLDFIVIDNFSGRLGNLAHHENDKHLMIAEADIYDYQRIESLFRGVDGVFHMASLADIVPSIQNQETYFLSNVDDTYSKTSRRTRLYYKVLHVGFYPMDSYIMALCCDKKLK